MKKHIVCIVGTRPEAIKMAPVILRLRERGEFRVSVLSTAQHRGLLDRVMTLFGIAPDVDLDVMRPNQTLPALTSRLIAELDGALATLAPDVVLAQGDTTTVMTAALASFYRRIPFGHVEAGLRTGDMANPFPEEMNRVLAGRLATWHFAPTASSRDNLLREGVPAEAIHVTGNTVVDALLDVAARPGLEIGVPVDPDKRLILVTSHRRENFGEPFLRICRAVRRIVEARPDVQVLYPVHPNPNVRDTAHRELGGRDRITLCEPLDYVNFIAAMKRAHLIVSDSGGVQEEAPALGKPVLVLRAETERPEAVAAGVVRLVGTDEERIVSEALALIDDPAHYASMARGSSPYGDGLAAGRIADILARA